MSAQVVVCGLVYCGRICPGLMKKGEWMKTLLGLGWLLVRDVGRELMNWRLALSAAVVAGLMKLVGLL